MPLPLDWRQRSQHVVAVVAYEKWWTRRHLPLFEGAGLLLLVPVSALMSIADTEWIDDLEERRAAAAADDDDEEPD